MTKTNDYILQKYGEPEKAAIWFANPYIPWHDQEVPGGKLGEELTLYQDGKCTIQAMVFNSKLRKPILGRPIEKVQIEPNIAQTFLKRLLTVLNYLGTPKKEKSFSLKETTIWTNCKSVTFDNYEDNEQLPLYKLSMDIRNALDRADLMVLDGNSHEDFIDKLEIKYRDTSNYEEKLILNRNKETINYQRKINLGQKVNTTYTFTDQISKILDNMDPIDFTSTIPGVPKNALKDDGHLGHFQCRIVRRKLSPIKISGDYERYNLPATWEDLMKLLSKLMDVPEIGVIPNDHYYNRRQRCKDDIIYLTVSFSSTSNKYDYLTKDDSIMIGDWVMVPVAKDNHLQQALVVDKNYYKKDEVPYPLAKIKKIADKVNED